MRKLLLMIVIAIPALSLAQSNSISTIDFVQIINGNRNETMFYYENNWKIYRDIAVERGFIKSYKLLVTTRDVTTNFDLILITEYSDSLQFKSREENFQIIMNETRPDGPIVISALKPNDFRKNLFSTQAQTVYVSEPKRRRK